MSIYSYGHITWFHEEDVGKGSLHDVGALIRVGKAWGRSASIGLLSKNLV
jgi:hypothetical protein